MSLPSHLPSTPTPWGDTLGELTEFRVAFNGIWSSVTLSYGDRRKKRMKTKKPCAPGAVKGGTTTGSSTAGECSVFCAAPNPAIGDQNWWLNCRRLSKQSRTLHPTAPVELPLKVVDPVEQVAQKRKATSPLDPRPATRPTNSPSPTRWELVYNRIKGRFKDYITPPLETIADLPCEPASRR